MTQGSSIGRSVRRLDGGEKVTGLTRFAGDLQLPRMLHARLVLSPHAHARIARVDGERGRGPARGPGRLRGRRSRSRPTSIPPREASRRSRSATRCSWGIRWPPSSPRRRRSPRTRPRSSRSSTSLCPAALDARGRHAHGRPARAGRGGRRRRGGAGDARGGDRRGAAPGGGRPERGEHAAVPSRRPRPRLRRGRRRGRAPLRDPHGPPGLPRAAGRGGRRRSARRARPSGPRRRRFSSRGRRCARCSGCRSTGCGSWRRRWAAASARSSCSWSLWPAALALRLRRPVSVVMTRTEEFLATTPAPPAVIELKVGARRDGTLTALEGRAVFDAGAYAGAPLGIALLLMGSYYQVPNLELRGYEVLTHKPGNGAYRAPGAVQGTFAHRVRDGRAGAGDGSRPHRPATAERLSPGRPHGERTAVAARWASSSASSGSGSSAGGAAAAHRSRQRSLPARGSGGDRRLDGRDRARQRRLSAGPGRHAQHPRGDRRHERDQHGIRADRGRGLRPARRGHPGRQRRHGFRALRRGERR